VIEDLTQKERNKLGLLKAIELSNVCIKLGYAQADQELADTISRLVRQTMRERSIKMGGLTVPLKEEALAKVIDQGARLFHLGRRDKATWLQACELSNQICKELHIEIYAGLKRLIKLVPGYTIELEWAVTDNFLNEHLQTN
jgi:hypothetical protein